MNSLDKRLEILKAVSHPARISILEELARGVKCVSDFEESLEISQPNVSQHLSLLKRMGVVDSYMDGRMRCYFLIDPMILDLLKLLGTKYEKPLPPPACCPVRNKRKPADKNKSVPCK